ncbi:hypothetical protein PWY87_06960 [Kribbella solani]|uniref:hypothetical protein n=1 Tax=Kribbella solani TaxID=236067 RepID=UPI0029BB4AC5|nr:hypothetical protein [Kribbella solani]MDX3001400.1 hypothetical protein [Kribbella solani]
MDLHHRPPEPARDVFVRPGRLMLDPTVRTKQPTLDARHPTKERFGRHDRPRHVDPSVERLPLEGHRNRQLVSQMLTLELTTRRRKVPLDEVPTNRRVKPPGISIPTPDMHKLTTRHPNPKRNRHLIGRRCVQAILHRSRRAESPFARGLRFVEDHEMTPPSGPGQHNVLKIHYERAGTNPVAYLDETYHVEDDGRRRFYVMAAVVVLEQDRDPLRNELDSIVPSGWWHTTNQLRTKEGRDQARELLQAFRVPDETCVIVDKISIEPTDSDGTRARGAVLGRLLIALHNAEHGSHPPVGLTVIEEHRTARINNYDRAVRAQLIRGGAINETSPLLAVSPGTEHLLWLPDLVCSAYRQKSVFRRGEMFETIEDCTHVIQLP